MVAPRPHRDPTFTAGEIADMKLAAAEHNAKRAHIGKRLTASGEVDRRYKYTDAERKELSKKVRSLQCWGCGRKFQNYKRLKIHQASCYWYTYFAKDGNLEDAPFFKKPTLSKQQRYLLRNPEKRREAARKASRKASHKKKLAARGIAIQRTGVAKTPASLAGKSRSPRGRQGGG